MTEDRWSIATSNNHVDKRLTEVVKDFGDLSWKNYTPSGVTIISNSPLNAVAIEYFKVKGFERRNQQSSEDVYDQWVEGNISGVEYSDWVTSYLKVWDAIDR